MTEMTNSPQAADLLSVRSRISWGAIAAGAMVALSIYIVLTMSGYCSRDRGGHARRIRSPRCRGRDLFDSDSVASDVFRRLDYEPASGG